MAAALDPIKAGAAAVINAQLASWGIVGLGKDVIRLLQQGLDASALMIELESTDAYKKRFAANEARRKAGLRVLPPAEYVATETAMKGVLRQFGLPKGFFDTQADTDKFIASDLSPAELQDRAQVAQQEWVLGDPQFKQRMKDYYGIQNDGEGIATVLNPKEALGTIQRRIAAAQLGAVAARQGLVVQRQRAESLISQGVSEDAVQQGYGQIADAIGTDQAIAHRFGSDVSLADEENARIVGLASSRRKIKDLQASEASLFAGGGSATGGALSGSGSGAY